MSDRPGPPCGHDPDENAAYAGTQWETDEHGRSPRCKVCWMWHNDPKARAAWSGGPPPPRLVSMPHEQWPRWARALEKRRAAGEAGVGDTLERVLRHKGGAFIKAVVKRLGFECGCAERQRAMNYQYPYPPAAS